MTRIQEGGVGRILVVEDDPSIRMGLEDTLAAKGYEVEVVGKGADGAERALSGRYDLVVLDVMLPDIDGGSARAAARRDGCRSSCCRRAVRSSTACAASSSVPTTT